MPIFEKKEDIFELLDKFEKSTAAEIEIADGDMRIHIKKQYDGLPYVQSKITAENTEVYAHEASDVINKDVKEAKKQDKSGQIFKAPIIGVYYAAPSPDSEPFVEVGTKVSKGSVLCIIEAMKVMNDIESEFDGEITEIFVENKQPVEFGQPLFRIKID